MSSISSSKGNHFVLVHGAAHGAWCWYRIRCLLESTGHMVTCPDLRGSGIDPTDPTTITTFEEYNQPLDDILSNLPEGEKVILVGHSAGGLSASWAVHNHPHKLVAAVFVGAAMYKNGLDSEQYVQDVSYNNSYFRSFVEKLKLIKPDVLKNGDSSIAYGATECVSKEAQGESLYQLSPLEDRALAAMLIRPFPGQAIRSAKFADGKDSEKLPRVYIKTLHDRYYSQEDQDLMIKKWPPSDVFEVDSDHFVMFSNPFEFLGLLLKVALKFGSH